MDDNFKTVYEGEDYTIKVDKDISKDTDTVKLVGMVDQCRQEAAMVSAIKRFFILFTAAAIFNCYMLDRLSPKGSLILMIVSALVILIGSII